MVLVTQGQFNKTLTSVIYNCSCLAPSEAIATLENYTCKSFVKLSPGLHVGSPCNFKRVYLRVQRGKGGRGSVWGEGD